MQEHIAFLSIATCMFRQRLHACLQVLTSAYQVIGITGSMCMSGESIVIYMTIFGLYGFCSEDLVWRFCSSLEVGLSIAEAITC